MQRGMLVQVVPGQTTEIFKRYPMPQCAQWSFSLIYKEEKDIEPRTLDLTCQSEQEFLLWFWGIQVGLPWPSFTVPALVDMPLHCGK